MLRRLTRWIRQQDKIDWQNKEIRFAWSLVSHLEEERHRLCEEWATAYELLKATSTTPKKGNK